jgi:hypothetical protein
MDSKYVHQLPFEQMVKAYFWRMHAGSFGEEGQAETKLLPECESPSAWEDFSFEIRVRTGRLGRWPN